MLPRGTVIPASPRMAPKGPDLTVATTSLVLVGLAIALVALLAPGAAAQTDEVTVGTFDANPRVLPPDGGALSLPFEAQTDASRILVEIGLVEPGRSQPSIIHETELVSTSDGTVTGPIEVPTGSLDTSGWWRVEVLRIASLDGDREQGLSVRGQTETMFYLHPDAPVAGLAEAPWPQMGGDAQHSGRTLAVGPQTVDVNRWTFRAQDARDFHEPVIAANGTVYAVTWSGDVYAIDQDNGEPLWPQPVRLDSSVTFPPALTEDGRVIVATDDGHLHAITDDGTRAWTRSIATSGSQDSALSPPVVGPGGQIHVLREPWTLVTVDASGTLTGSQAIPPPEGYPPQIGPAPTPVESPPLAVERDGDVVAVAEGGLSLHEADTTPIRTVACNCTPRAVNLVPGEGIAVLAAGEEALAVRLSDAQILWRTGESGIPALQGTIWRPPSVGWTPGSSQTAWFSSEDGALHRVTMNGRHEQSLTKFDEPVRGQVVIDGNGNVYFADACWGIRSLTSEGAPRWTKEIEWESCTGTGGGLVVARTGAVLWAAPDGTLRMLGGNQLPVAQFEAGWEEGRFRLDATKSYDPDGASLTYAWSLGDGSTAQGPVVQHEYPQPGNYTVELVISDGLSTVSTSRVLTVNFPPTPRILDESQGQDLRLNASGTTDPDGDTLTFNWTVEGELAGDGPVLVINASQPRVYDVELTVWDGTHEVTVERTLLAPARATWTHITLALYEGDCPSGVCSLPAQVTLTNGTLSDVLVVNGAGRTVRATSELPTVHGGRRAITLEPGEQGTLHLRATEGQQRAMRVDVLGDDREPTRVPILVRPAPAQLTWRVLGATQAPMEGQGSSVAVALAGTAPPQDVDLIFSMADRQGTTVASTRVTLPGGEPVNRTVEIPWTPGQPGTHEIRFDVRAEDPGAAEVRPASEDDAQRSFAVAEATLLATAQRVITANLGLLALSIVAIAGAAGGVVWWRERETPTTGTTMTPVSTGSTSPVAEDDATVAQSFMPRKVERFHVERVLGEGGFGRTYLARDTVLEREVVLKELEHVGSGEARDLLLHEAKTAANLSHPNVVVVHDVVEEEGRLLLVMEYVPGGTLKDKLGDPMDLKAALPLITDMLEGLSALHEAGIVHRDLKPSNILITPDDVAKITDFGVAARIDGSPPTNGDGDETFVGTPRYMAPEQLAGDAPGPTADVYATAGLLYQMLTGRHHLGLDDETPSVATLVERAPELPAPELPDELNRILENALARDPAKRYQTAEEFLRALRRFRGEATTASGETSSPSP